MTLTFRDELYYYARKLTLIPIIIQFIPHAVTWNWLRLVLILVDTMVNNVHYCTYHSHIVEVVKLQV
jgi:hypothetical protein